MNEKREDKIEFVKWFSELDKNSGDVAGGKGANLAEIYNLRVNVPPGFVITAQAYDYFIEKAGLNEKIKEILKSFDYEDTKQLNQATEKIRNSIINAEMPHEMKEEILESYANLDTTNIKNVKGTILEILGTSEPVFVAVRSSATTEDLVGASFAGQQESFLNVKGNDELIKTIKRCFASLFTSRATYYRAKKGFEKTKASLAVVVQRMVDSEKSGVIFSKDPTNRSENIILEAVFGLGEGIVSGRITPDDYMISRELEILSKTVADKKIAITRDSSGKNEIVQLSAEKSNSPVLKEYEAKKLAEISLKLEEHYNKPQDIEFAIEGDEIYVVQTRPITTLEKKSQTTPNEIKGEIILTGLGASPGIASGAVKIIHEMADLEKIQTGDILVTSMTNPDMVVSMQKSAAIITDEGGLTAHASIVSREMGIPAVVGTRQATTTLKDGDLVTVDGNTGNVYSGKIAENQKKEILPVTANTKTKIKVMVDMSSFAERASKTGIKQVGLTRIEGIIAESGKHPNYFVTQGKIEDYEELVFKGLKGIAEYFDEMWVRTSDIRSDEYQNLEGATAKVEVNPMLGMHGIRYALKNPDILKAELNAMKRLTQMNKVIGILLPQVISVDEVVKVKEILKEIDFTNAKLGVMVETPAAVQLIKELCEEGIAFISFGTNDLTQYILAIDRGNEQLQELYDEMHPAVLYQLEFVIRVCKRAGVETSICGQAGSKKEMVKFLVEKGIDSISVNADVAKEISDYVMEIETQQGIGERQYQPKKENISTENTQNQSEESTPKIHGLIQEEQQEEQNKEEEQEKQDKEEEQKKEVQEDTPQSYTSEITPYDPNKELNIF